jgi:branched-subunit amino acid transport protein
MTIWIVVVAVGLGTIVFKGLGPAVIGDRPLPPTIASLVGVLAPTLLAALVVTQTVGGSDGIAADARLVGVGAGALAIALRAPLLVVVIVAAAATAIVRAVG